MMVTLADSLNALASAIGSNLKTVKQSLNRMPLTSVVASSTVTAINGITGVTTGSTPITLTLPSSASTGDVIEIIKLDIGTGSVSITGLGTLMGAGRNDCLFVQSDWIRLWYNGSSWMPVMWNVKPIFDIYSATGSSTWLKYPLASTITVECIGAGAGGGAGMKGVSGTAAYGGGPGGNGAHERRSIPNSALPNSSISVTIGAGGTGGTAQTTANTTGANGNGGGSTSFGTSSNSFFVISRGGFGGGGGSSTSGAGSAGFPGDGSYCQGGNSSSISGSGNGYYYSLIPSAAAGGGISTTPTAYAGGIGYQGQHGVGAGTASSGGVASSSAAGGAGTNGTLQGTGPENWWWAIAPSGGGASTAGAGGSGGNGVGRGIAGSGGGASLGSNNSGSGGNGGSGYLQIRNDF